VYPVSSIDLQRNRPEQFGQFTGCIATRQVHLEEAILAVYISRRISQVDAIGGCYDRDTTSISLYRDICRQTISEHFTIEVWKTPGQDPIGEHGRNDSEYSRHSGDSDDESFHFRMFRDRIRGRN
jgi:hypothetical protein